MRLSVTGHGSFTTKSTSCSGIRVYPSPDTVTASPTTQISFRHVPAAHITNSSIHVSGSRTGAHTGRIVADSTGNGASFYPAKPFSPGERVDVTAPDTICGAKGSSAHFTVTKVKTHALPKGKSTRKTKPTTAGDLQHFATEPDLEPPVVTVDKAHPDPKEGDFLLGSKGGTVPAGAMIMDGSGNLVWYHPLPKGQEATDLRVRTYKGRPVLTFWQGESTHGHGAGKGIIMDRSYQVVGTVSAGNGYDADLHEFLLEPDGTAWVTAYAKVPADLSAQGGPDDAPVYDGIVQQIDVATGNVLFEWHSLDHVALSASKVDYDKTDADAYDYFHVNSIEPSGKGTILISARNTSAAYLLNQATGAVIWTLGGKHSSFKMGDGTEFGYQHDARMRGSHSVTIFDDETETTPARLLALDLDLHSHKASVIWDYTAPGDIPVVAQGNLQLLANGNLVSGWGSANTDGPSRHSTTITEYTDDGKMLFHARFKGTGINTYRAYRAPWSGRPASAPAVKVTGSGAGTKVSLSWNGATDVASWDLVSRTGDGSTHSVASKPKSSFETVIPVSDLPAGTEARALDANGKVLATAEVPS